MRAGTDNLTILVNSCDKYSDLWYPFFFLLKKHWKGKVPSIILNTESSTYSFDGLAIKNVNKKTTQWGERFISAINEVETDYILIMLDDFFVRREINVLEIEKCIDRLEKDKDIAVFYFNDVDEQFSYGFTDSEYDDYYLAKDGINYLYNLQSAVWRKSDLVKTILPQDTPWTWELLRNRYCNIHKKFYFLNGNKERVVDYGFNSKGMGVFKGKWVYEDVNPLFNSIGYEVDYQKRGIYQGNDSRIVSFLNYVKSLYKTGVFWLKNYVITRKNIIK